MAKQAINRGALKKVKIDVLRRKVEPKILNHVKIKELLPGIFQFLEYLMKTEGMEEIKLTEMALEYDFGVDRVSLYDDCKASIKTVSGRSYEVELTEANN